jgi:hypothetical protein
MNLQVQQVRSRLEEQIVKQKAEVEDLRLTLEHRIRGAVEEKIRSQLQDMIRDTIQQQIEEKVQQQVGLQTISHPWPLSLYIFQLSAQIPEDLRQQVISHQRQILEVKTSLHNRSADMNCFSKIN